jgi:hypothetical protein
MTRVSPPQAEKWNRMTENMTGGGSAKLISDRRGDPYTDIITTKRNIKSLICKAP